MVSELPQRIRKAFVSNYPDKFPNLKDLPMDKMFIIVREKGINDAEIKYITTTTRFNLSVEKSGVKLEGLVLDLCSERISIASVYDKNKVVCYDILSEVMQELKNKNIKSVQASVKDRAFPFKNNSFDYLFCEGFPMSPYKTKEGKTSKIRNYDAYLRRIIREMIRVTKKKAIICSIPIMDNFPKKYEHRIEKRDLDEYVLVLNCKD